MDLLAEFTAYVKAHSLFTREHKLLIAISGGIDSVVLTHLCKEAGYDLQLAHCNFNLRGAESERDEAFVKKLAEGIQVKLWTKKFDTEQYASDNKCSIQVAARSLRYDWFESLMAVSAESGTGFDFLLTAHHLDDNVETVLMNFCKGTGVKGLAGIQQKRGKILRPLLFATRQQIEAYAAAAHLAWVEDSSNEERKYTRNYFRQVVIPQLKQVFPEVVQNIQGSIGRFQEISELYEQAIGVHKTHLIEKRGAEVHIPVLKLLRARPVKSIVYEIIREYGFRESQVAGVLDLLHSESGKYTASATHRILRNRAWIIISPLATSEQQVVVIERGEASVVFQGGVLEIKEEEVGTLQFSANKLEACIDAKHVEFPLLLRRWKEGDYFYPLGMAKKKKLARFFIDQKMSKTEKENIWVLESAKRIVWVLGQRIDNRFKISAGTSEMLRLELKAPGTASQKPGRSR